MSDLEDVDADLSGSPLSPIDENLSLLNIDNLPIWPCKVFDSSRFPEEYLDADKIMIYLFGFKKFTKVPKSSIQKFSMDVFEIEEDNNDSDYDTNNNDIINDNNYNNNNTAGLIDNTKYFGDSISNPLNLKPASKCPKIYFDARIESLKSTPNDNIEFNVDNFIEFKTLLDQYTKICEEHRKNLNDNNLDNNYVSDISHNIESTNDAFDETINDSNHSSDYKNIKLQADDNSIKIIKHKSNNIKINQSSIEQIIESIVAIQDNSDVSRCLPLLIRLCDAFSEDKRVEELVLKNKKLLEHLKELKNNNNFDVILKNKLDTILNCENSTNVKETKNLNLKDQFIVDMLMNKDTSYHNNSFMMNNQNNVNNVSINDITNSYHSDAINGNNVSNRIEPDISNYFKSTEKISTFIDNTNSLDNDNIGSNNNDSNIASNSIKESISDGVDANQANSNIAKNQDRSIEERVDEIFGHLNGQLETLVSGEYLRKLSKMK